MATENRRIVGYLPVPYHNKLRDYMERESVTESAAIIKIIKQFFDGTPETKVADSASSSEIAQLRADITQLQQRLAILEQVMSSVRQFSPTSSRRSYQQPKAQVIPPPQDSPGLARRLGVSPSAVEEAYQKGEAHFRTWTRRLDPAKRSWCKRGGLFHPEAD